MFIDSSPFSAKSLIKEDLVNPYRLAFSSINLKSDSQIFMLIWSVAFEDGLKPPNSS
jgi:hypothetical protein